MNRLLPRLVFSEKKKKKKNECRLLQILLGALRFGIGKVSKYCIYSNISPLSNKCPPPTFLGDKCNELRPSKDLIFAKRVDPDQMLYRPVCRNPILFFLQKHVSGTH